MRLVIIFCLQGLGISFAYAQNLVPNFSFEDVDSNQAPEEYIVDWTFYGTTDLYSTNSAKNSWPAPCNAVGCQDPYSGENYLGIYVYNDNIGVSNHREYFQTALTSQLDSGKNYCISFYTSKGDTMELVSNNWGILMSVNPVSPPSMSDFLIEREAQFLVSDFISDEDNWTNVAGIFNADSSYNYITTGSFISDDSTNSIQVKNSCSICVASYYFIDYISISLIRDPVLQNDTTIYSGESLFIGDTAQDAAQYSWYPTNGLSNPNSWQTLASPLTTTTYTLTKISPCDTTEASIRIEVLATENNLTILPNPNNGNFQINYNLIEDAKFVIYDALGRKVYHTNLISGSNILFAPQILPLASAVYLLTLESTDNELLFQTKMVVSDY